MISQVMLKIDANRANKYDLKYKRYDVILGMHILLLNELLLLQIQIMMCMTKNYLLKIMRHLFFAFLKLIIHSLTMQKI